jgi:hypothetical protein
LWSAFGPSCADNDLRTWGLELSKRCGKNARRRAKVAVARKLAVLLHRLWVTGEVYEPTGYGEAATGEAGPPSSASEHVKALRASSATLRPYG